MTDRQSDFDRLGDLLRDVCGPAVSGEAVEAPVGSDSSSGSSTNVARLVAAAWAETVGEEVAANARPMQLRQGRLTVSASSSAWAQTLQLMTETIKDRLNERLEGMGATTITEVVFRHAGWEERGRRSQAVVGWRRGGSSACGAGTSLPPTPEEETAMEEVRELGLESDLELLILRAMRAAFERT